MVYIDVEFDLVILFSGLGEFIIILVIDGDFMIQDFNIGLVIDYIWFGDFFVIFLYEGGLFVILFDQLGVLGLDFGCFQDNMLVGFDDEVLFIVVDFENLCEVSGLYGIFGNFQFLDLLFVFVGLLVFGIWIFIISDVFNQDGGNLVLWLIEVCFFFDVLDFVEVLVN